MTLQHNNSINTVSTVVIIFITFLNKTKTSNVTSVNDVRSVSVRLFVSTWRYLVSVMTTHYYVAIIFHRPVWYRALSLRYVCIWSSGCIILVLLTTFVPNFVSFTTCIAELANGEKSRTQSITQSLTHPAYLTPGPRGTEALALRNKVHVYTHCCIKCIKCSHLPFM